MLLHIPDVLSAGELLQCRGALATADWCDGRETVGAQGAQVKRNRQLPEDSPIGERLGALILAALSGHPLFVSAALPLRTAPPLFNRYEGGEHYGLHIDGAIRALPGSASSFRAFKFHAESIPLGGLFGAIDQRPISRVSSIEDMWRMENLLILA